MLLTFSSPTIAIKPLLLAASDFMEFVLVHLLGIALGTDWQAWIDASATCNPAQIGGIIWIAKLILQWVEM